MSVDQAAEVVAERFGPLAELRRERTRRPSPPPRGPYGVWLIARTPTSQRYPCRCGEKCARYCPCENRPDAATMPAHCCARRAHDTEQRQQRQQGEQTP